MKLQHIITAFLCAITLGVTAFAVTPEEAKKVHVTISLSNMPVAEVLKYVSQCTNIKTHYAAAKDDAAITVELSDVPADDVFTHVSQLANLSVTYKDDGVHFARKEPLQVQIEARYDGFGIFHDSLGVYLSKEDKPDNLLSAPKVTIKSGQRATVAMIREVPVPESPDGEKKVDCGITLEVLPVVKDGQITLSGKSVWRRRLVQDASQPLGAISFATQETYFGGAVPDGKELTIAVDDGPEHKARIFLTARLVAPSAAQAK